jgi:hypothetical protein
MKEGSNNGENLQLSCVHVMIPAEVLPECSDTMRHFFSRSENFLTGCAHTKFK